MTHGQGEHAGAAIDANMGIPQQFGLGSPGALAPGDLPGFALAPVVVKQLVAFLPAHHKAHAEAGEPREPGTGAVPAIEDMAHLASPLSCGPGQQLLLLLALLSLDSFLSSPPGHGYHLRPALFAYQQQAFPFKPPHTHWHATGPIEHAFAAAGQPAHPTGTHGSQSFQVLALRLLQHTAVPDAQRRLSSALQLLAPLLRLLPQHLFDDSGFPSLMV